MRKFKAPGFYLVVKFFKNNKTAYKTILRNKTVFALRTEAKWNQVLPGKAYIKVHYNKEDYNDGIYSSLPDLKFALQAFTEQSFVNGFRKGEVKNANS